MKLEWKIAWRYLFQKKKHNAINVVSGVSAAGVATVTAAMIIVLSVMNGFGGMIRQMFSTFDPQLKVLPREGKSFSLSDERFEALQQMPEIAVLTQVVEETGLVYFDGRQVPAILKGVEENFSQLTDIDSIIVDGHFALCDYFEDIRGIQQRVWERCVIGRGLANQIGIGAHFVGGIKLYAPTRTGKVNLMRPDKSFHESGAFIAGVFAVNQVKYDDQYMLVSLPLARELFEYQPDEVTALEIRLASNANEKRVQKQIATLLGDDFLVLNRYEQQADFYKIMRVEKLLSALLLIFILIIACFNIIGSLSMLVIDKKNDIEILRDLGAQPTQVQKTFLYEGWLVSLIGMGVGLLIGLIICLLQQYLGIVKLGNGIEYIISAYPVEVHAGDVLFVMLIVALIGFATAWIPTKSLKTIALLGILLLTSCSPIPQPQETVKEYNNGWLEYYGAHYHNVGIESHVISLNLLSKGLSINDSTGYVEGSGLYLLLTDIFIEPFQTHLPAGIYKQDTTAAPFTFLPAMDYEGNHTGSLLYTIADGGVEQNKTQLFDKGYFELKYLRDTAFFTFTLTNTNGQQYNATAKCILPIYDYTLR